MATAIKTFNIPLIEMDFVENKITTMSSHIKQLSPKGHKENGVFISTNMNAPNIRTKTQFGKTFYYTIRGIKQSKAEGLEYVQPLSLAFENAKEGEYVVCAWEACGAKAYRSYGSLSFRELEKYAWGENNGLFEQVGESDKRKMYFDIDDRYISEEHIQKQLQLIHEIIAKVLNLPPNDDIDAVICYGKGDNGEYIKASYHMIIQGYYFANHADMLKCMRFIQHIVNMDNKYAILQNKVMDFNVYGKRQAFKLPYQKKPKKKIKQIPLNDEDTLDNYLLTYIDEDAVEIDVSEFEKYAGKEKQVKLATGKSIKVDFTKAMIIDAMKTAVSKDFQVDIGKMPDTNNIYENLDYYLNSIPNNEKMPKLVWKSVGYCISNITQNTEKGLIAWHRWTQGYGKCDIEDMRDEFMKHEISKGYGWKTLHQLASLFNPQMKKSNGSMTILFSDWVDFDCEKKNINERYLPSNLMRDSLVENDNIFVSSPMGTGKSHTCKIIFDAEDKWGEKKYPSILYLSCKRAFASAMCEDFKKYGFVNYMDVEYKPSIRNVDRIICSVESITHCRHKYDLVIIDESESICDNLTGDMFRKNRPTEGISHITDIIKNSQKIITMDAFLSTRSINMIKEIKHKTIDEEKSIYIKNDYLHKKRTYKECDKKRFVDNIKKCLDAGKRCAVVCGSSGLADHIKKDNDGKQVKHYSAKNPLEIGTNVDKEWSECDLLIYTPTITAGISYDNKEKPFDVLFVYSVNKGSCHFRDTAQASRRIREFNDNCIYLCLNDNFKGFNYDCMPITKEDVIAQEVMFSSQLFGEQTKSVREIPEFNWVWNIYIHNILEKNISSRCLREFAREYLQRMNIVKYHFENDPDKLDMDDDEEWDFDTIKTIPSRTYEDFQEQIKSHENLEDEEFQEYMKFRYSRMLVKKDCKHEVMVKYFNKNLHNARKRGFMKNVMEFKKMFNEIKNVGGDINKYKIKKYEDDVMPMEYYDKKYLRWEHIMCIMKTLGIVFSDDGEWDMDINKDFFGMDFNGLVEKYKALPVKALNSMMNNNHFNTKKQFKDGRSVQGIFNQLLREEFGMELKSDGHSFPTIDGKKKKLTKFKIQNQLTKEQTERCDAEFLKERKYLLFNILREEFDSEIPYIEVGEEESSSEEECNQLGIMELLETSDEEDFIVEKPIIKKKNLFARKKKIFVIKSA